SWHHVYAVIGWTRPFVPESYTPLYPGFSVEHNQLVKAVYAIVRDDDACASFVGDRRAFANRFGLSNDEADALAALDEDVLRERFSVNPILTYHAKFRTGDKLRNSHPVAVNEAQET